MNLFVDLLRPCLVGSTKTVIQLLSDWIFEFRREEEEEEKKNSRENWSCQLFFFPLINSATKQETVARWGMNHIWAHSCSACISDLIRGKKNFCYSWVAVAPKFARNNLMHHKRDTVTCCFHCDVVVASFICYFYQCFRGDLVSLCWLGNAIARYRLEGGRAWGRDRSLTEENRSLVRPSRA